MATRTTTKHLDFVVAIAAADALRFRLRSCHSSRREATAAAAMRTRIGASSSTGASGGRFGEAQPAAAHPARASSSSPLPLYLFFSDLKKKESGGRSRKGESVVVVIVVGVVLVDLLPPSFRASPPFCHVDRWFLFIRHTLSCRSCGVFLQKSRPRGRRKQEEEEKKTLVPAFVVAVVGVVKGGRRREAPQRAAAASQTRPKGLVLRSILSSKF